MIFDLFWGFFWDGVIRLHTVSMGHKEGLKMCPWQGARPLVKDSCQDGVR